MVVTFAVCQAVWLDRMLRELKYEQKGLTKILCDNKSAIALTKNPMFHSIRDLLKNQKIKLQIFWQSH